MSLYKYIIYNWTKVRHLYHLLPLGFIKLKTT
nr:MAG TPA: hypothetical protein [Caudoviricetes sp.]